MPLPVLGRDPAGAWVGAARPPPRSPGPRCHPGSRKPCERGSRRRRPRPPEDGPGPRLGETLAGQSRDNAVPRVCPPLAALERGTRTASLSGSPGRPGCFSHPQLAWGGAGPLQLAPRGCGDPLPRRGEGNVSPFVTPPGQKTLLTPFPPSLQARPNDVLHPRHPDATFAPFAARRDTPLSSVFRTTFLSKQLGHARRALKKEAYLIRVLKCCNVDVLQTLVEGGTVYYPCTLGGDDGWMDR